jgi:hypothetical protein
MLRAFGPTRMCHQCDTGGTRLVAKVVPKVVSTYTGTATDEFGYVAVVF